MESVFQEEVRRIKERGKSVLLSSHILSEVEKLCDTITIIKEGRIIESGKLEDMRHLAMTRFRISGDPSLPELEKVNFIKDFSYREGLAEFYVEGDKLNELISLVSKNQIRTFEAKPASLEDIFMRHYE